MAIPLDQCRGLPERTFEGGEVLIQEGVPGPLFVLAEGSVEIVKGEFALSIVDEPGSIFGEISALLEVPPTATVRALGQTRTFVAQDGRAFLSTRPELALAIARMLAQRLAAVTRDLADLKRRLQER
jgi:CRP-like cAMP-binding protein